MHDAFVLLVALALLVNVVPPWVTRCFIDGLHLELVALRLENELTDPGVERHLCVMIMGYALRAHHADEPSTVAFDFEHLRAVDLVPSLAEILVRPVGPTVLV